MKYQRGVSLSGLLVWSVIIALGALLVMRVVPSALEYFKIVKDAKAAVGNVPAGATVADVRRSFARYAEIDSISDLRPEDLDISKEGGQVVISFAYDKKIPLFANLSLLIEYKGSTAGSGKD